MATIQQLNECAKALGLHQPCSIHRKKICLLHSTNDVHSVLQQLKQSVQKILLQCLQKNYRVKQFQWRYPSCSMHTCPSSLCRLPVLIALCPGNENCG